METRINPESGIVEESHLGGLVWLPKENPDGSQTRVNTESGVVEESHLAGLAWLPKENENGRETRINTETGVLQESHLGGLVWLPHEHDSDDGRSDQVRSSSGSEVGYSSGAASVSDADGPTRQSSVVTVPAKKQKKDAGPNGLVVAVLGLGVTFLACGVLESLSHPRSTVALPERKEYRPEPPPAIRSGTLWWGFISFLGIFIGSFIFGHALFVFDGPWAYRLIEAIFAVLVLLPSRDFLLDSAESRKISLEIHAESEIRRREEWERQQDKKFGPRSA